MIKALTRLTDERKRKIQNAETKCMEADGTKYRMYLNSDINPDKRMKCFYIEERGGIVRSVLSITDFGMEGMEIRAFTVPEYRGQGLFSALWKEAGAMLTAHGVKKIRIFCEKESEDGRAVLKHMGARKVCSEYLLELEIAGETSAESEEYLQENSQVTFELQSPKNGRTVLEFPVWKMLESDGEESAEPSDAVLENRDALEELFEACFPTLAASMPERISEHIDMGARIWMGKENGILVGMCVTLLEEETAYLYDVCVRKEWRRRGVASTLIAAVRNDLRRIGIVRLRLQVSSKNTGAVKLYKKLGFWEKERIDYYRL